MDREKVTALFEKYIRKLRITPAGDVKLEFVEDPEWRKTGDFKIDCDDRKAILLLNAVSPKQENIEEVIVHELMHIKMYPLDQVTESLIKNCFEPISSSSPPWSRPLRKWPSASCWSSAKIGASPSAGAPGPNPSTSCITD